MYRHLTLLRLRWNASATGRVLVRHWQVFVLVGALVPGGMPVGKLLMSLGYPLLAALHVGHDVLWHWWHLVAIQGLALAWVMVQRRHIDGGAFMAYARSLPLSVNQRRRADLSVLLKGGQRCCANARCGVGWRSTRRPSSGCCRTPGASWVG